MAGTITRVLEAVRAGDRAAFGDVFPLVYEDLRQMARRRMNRERPGHALHPTDLVHESYFKLARLNRIEWKNRAQFFALAAHAMRQVLVDEALKHKAKKRGGGEVHVTLSDEIGGDVTPTEEILALEQALKRLEATRPRQVEVVTCRFFAGMDVEETAAALGISKATVKRDWALARIWLNQELSPPGQASE